MTDPLAALTARAETPLGRALRRIAKGKRLSSLDVPVLEDAAAEIDLLTAEFTRLSQAHAETQAVEPLTAWVTGETVAERDAAFLRMYAAKLLDGTAKAWEIPNTVASTLQDIAKRRLETQAALAASEAKLKRREARAEERRADDEYFRSGTRYPGQ